MEQIAVQALTFIPLRGVKRTLVDFLEENPSSIGSTRSAIQSIFVHGDSQVRIAGSKTKVRIIQSTLSDVFSREFRCSIEWEDISTDLVERLQSRRISCVTDVSCTFGDVIRRETLSRDGERTLGR